MLKIKNCKLNSKLNEHDDVIVGPVSVDFSDYVFIGTFIVMSLTKILGQTLLIIWQVLHNYFQLNQENKMYKIEQC